MEKEQSFEMIAEAVVNFVEWFGNGHLSVDFTDVAYVYESSELRFKTLWVKLHDAVVTNIDVVIDNPQGNKVPEGMVASTADISFEDLMKEIVEALRGMRDRVQNT